MDRSAIRQRLGMYWKLEAVNVILIPGSIVYLGNVLGWALGPVTVVAFVPVCLLLAIGAQYWRAKLIQINSARTLPPTISLLARLQWPSLIVTLGAVCFALASWAIPELSASRSDRWVGSFAALLAVLEYVNYYHRQVQHFDHAPDFARLRHGRGFRRSQMAVDIRRWRTRVASQPI